jgi:transcription elongation GreA/GreB family factor
VNTLSVMSVDDRLVITVEGYEDLCTGLEALQGHIAPELSERLRDARQDGHLADNPPLFDLLAEQAQFDQGMPFSKRASRRRRSPRPLPMAAQGSAAGSASVTLKSATSWRTSSLTPC